MAGQFSYTDLLKHQINAEGSTFLSNFYLQRSMEIVTKHLKK
jgi:hypothetical protein